jgi:transposase
MYEGYIQAAREALPHVRIVIDRFHVAQQYRNAADTVRKQELNRLKRELPKAEYQQLKGSLRAFRKNQADLSADEQTLVMTHKFVWTAGHSRYHGEHRGHICELRVLRGKNELRLLWQCQNLTLPK